MTNFLIQHIHDSRRIFTDGREWPKKIEPTFVGYSIGKWIDTDGDGRYDVLEIETRGLKGPRSFDPAGIPLASDNQSIFKERVYSDKADPNILYDEITTIDNALTRPWSVTKTYTRVPVKQPEWIEEVCAEGNSDVEIDHQGFFLSGDGSLMPTKKGQAPPPRDRARWYTEPAKVFDDVYFVGTKDRSSWALTTSEGIILIDTTYEYETEPVIVGGLRKLGLDPASVKYVIITHAHSGEVGGAKLMQDRFGSRIVIGEGDWGMIEQSVNRFPNGKPKRHIVAQDGQKITLGGRAA